MTPDLHEVASPQGLSNAEAAARLQRDGPNALPQPERRSQIAIVLAVLREPMLLLLLAATGVYLLLGNAGEALLLAFSVGLVIALTVYQEHKAERALQALRDLSSPRARVLRDGVAVIVPAQDVVIGDVLLVSAGERVPADARVLEESDLHVDESLLTGESGPQRRPPGGTDDDALLHAGTLVVRGHGRACVLRTGATTSIGRIGVALHDLRPEPTLLQREIRRLVLLFAGLSLASCIALTGLYVVLRGGWLDALLAGLTLAMANIPEEFPVVLTVFLALGAWRMAQKRALVRRIPAIEALGAITVLCTDKTGTLTENRMRLVELAGSGERWSEGATWSPPLLALLHTAMRASPRLSYDPMERALHAAWSAHDDRHDPSRCIREFAFSPHCAAVAALWCADDGRISAACKGAPETVADLCRLDDAQRATVHAEAEEMAARGLRVLGIAHAPLPADEPLPDHLEALPLMWLGLAAFADPLRAGVADAVAEARRAGVRVVMLTGDHPETARSIARAAGIGNGARVVLGADLDGAGASDDVSSDVYARVRPEHKLHLVEALKRRGEVVAMTGDGVNDAPALLAAHVGVAMGGRGTDVAREAAAIVLLDDNFVTVVHAIRMGRTIYDNIRRAVRYILAVHVPITGLALLPLLLGVPLVLAPLHVVFLELIIDPACTIVFEHEPTAAGTMQRPPRAPGERMVDLRVLVSSLGQGAVMFAATALVLLLAVRAGIPPPQRGALAFTSLVAGNLGLIVLYRGDRGLWGTLLEPNAAFWIVGIAALSLLVTVTWTTPAASAFGFVPPSLRWWLAALIGPLLLAACMKAAGAMAR